MRDVRRTRIAAVCAIVAACVAAGALVYRDRAGAPARAARARAVDEVWSALRCSGDRFVDTSRPGRTLEHADQVSELRCDADNPTGFVAMVGSYARPTWVQRDVRASPQMPACASARVAVVGFFSVAEMRTLCRRLGGTLVARTAVDSAAGARPSDR